MTIRIAVAGAHGWMGREVVRLIDREPNFELVAAVSPSQAGQLVHRTIGAGPPSMVFVASVQDALSSADVLVDFTHPGVVQKHIELALEAGVRPVIGTSGLNEALADRWADYCEQRRVGCVIAPNFAIGAVLMMNFAAQASRYLPHVEIIEAHHDQKLDAPSGTAIKTSEMIASRRPALEQGHPEEKEILPGARGGSTHGFRIHSVRLPGLFSHHEVLCSGAGQLLTIRHDALNREAFMPGVKLAVEKVVHLKNMVYGLEKLLFSP
ncbi:4-hydroxy-tetrahydrodipicolinate reductase [Pasteuria penetrans]|uniref:4-hydroxy-tetrahydrodipicolinate reductase n=1 Tax=Pasteuria penetrans TaxID=86005 RepID=UPI000FC0B3C7|nr:4-hydroxy-tetrahydrodipicolinate reductase [Pasteuria penetrans]